MFGAIRNFFPQCWWWIRGYDIRCLSSLIYLIFGTSQVNQFKFWFAVSMVNVILFKKTQWWKYRNVYFSDQVTYRYHSNILPTKSARHFQWINASSYCPEKPQGSARVTWEVSSYSLLAYAAAQVHHCDGVSGINWIFANVNSFGNNDHMPHNVWEIYPANTRRCPMVF